MKKEVYEKAFVFSKSFSGILIVYLSIGMLSAGSCPIKQDTNFVFYGESGSGGVGSISKTWLIHFLEWWKEHDNRISYMALSAGDIKSNCNLTGFPNLKVYVQPGGDAYYQQKALGSSGKSRLRSYINSGKGFVGICAGFYYAAADYYWQGKYYNWQNLLGMYPSVEGSITTIADYDVSPGYAIIELSNREKMVYYGGPTRGFRFTPQSIVGEKLLMYTSVPGELAASVRHNNMLLMSVHAEAYEDVGITGLTKEQRIRNYIWFAKAINIVAGTDFRVPELHEESVCGNIVCESGEDWNNCSSDCRTPECADGIDNDLDGLFDFPEDNDCTDLNDDSEDSRTTVLFQDNFESGLSKWMLSRAGNANNWVSASTNPYQGSWYAEAKPMSTSEPAAVMETNVQKIGRSSVVVSYYRRLVGIDTGDEFKLKWFDGNNWNILEETGSGFANDMNYVYKEFLLPRTADDKSEFMIRFECTAGAVSEYCRIDNVLITAY